MRDVHKQEYKVWNYSYGGSKLSHWYKWFLAIELSERERIISFFSI